MNTYDLTFIFYTGFILLCLIIVSILFVWIYIKHNKSIKDLNEINKRLNEHQEIIKEIEKLRINEKG